MTVHALLPEQLYRSCDQQQFDFETTSQISDCVNVVGHERAIEATRFSMEIERSGYNLYAIGAPGTGRHEIIAQLLEEYAATRPKPDDWCYVHNFKSPGKPVALHFPPGTGRLFQEGMEQLLDDLRTTIRAAFESEEYQNGKQTIEQEFRERQEEAINEMREEARGRGISLIPTPTGFAFAPLVDGEIISPEAFQKLPKAAQEDIEKNIGELQKKMQERMGQLPIWQRETRHRIMDLNRDTTLTAVRHLIGELTEQFGAIAGVNQYLQEVQEDVVKNAFDFLVSGEEHKGVHPGQEVQPGNFNRYRVNLLIENDNGAGAPVIHLDNPSYPSLVGRVEHLAQFGALTTDQTLIQPGALHKATGGYLTVDATKILANPYSWEALKRALRSGQIVIEPMERMYGFAGTVTLEPQPVPLNTKVVLVGDRRLYYLLSQYDPDFLELFKVAADFDDTIDRNRENDQRYACLIGGMANREALLPFDRSGVARLIEHGSRVAGDAEKISISRDVTRDLMIEADYQARKQGDRVVGQSHIQRAIDAQIRRNDRLRESSYEQILRETILIDTQGEQVGQINALSVLDLGNFAFGRPTRITARVRAGSGGVLDIERKVELGGSLHSKGVLILSSYLASRYDLGAPIALSASLVFEQSYGGVDGDSASSTELYALLSALSGIPIRQSLAVTGSVNQLGQVQAIGGVNEKIEGFFDLCKARGLSGDQGVLIPNANVKHLMLREDVIQACAAGKFHIYPVSAIDQGIELLTGVAAGQPGADGTFPAGSINRLVVERLREFANSIRKMHGNENTQEDHDDNQEQ